MNIYQLLNLMTQKMKMKKYLLLFVAALALGFASCSDDETIPNLTGIAIESEGGVTEVIKVEHLH